MLIHSAILSASVLLQFTAAALAIRLIKVTGWTAGWAVIAAALGLIGVRRSITLYRIFSSDAASSPDLTAELVALLIAVLMTVGVGLFTPGFRALWYSKRALTQSFAKFGFARWSNASEQFLRIVLDQIPIGISVKDRDARYLFVNKAFEKIFAVSAEATLGKTFAELGRGGPLQVQRVTEEDDLLLKTGERIEMKEVEVILPDQGQGWRHLIKAPLQDDFGEIIGLVSVIEDITEKKRAEEDLRASRKLLQTIFDLIPHPIIVRDMEHRFVLVNKATAERFNARPEDFEGARFDEFRFGSDQNMRDYLETERQVLATGKRVEVPEYSVQLPGGEERTVHIIKLPLLDDRMAVTGVVLISQDITTRKTLETQLRQAQKMEAVGLLAAGVAHDFNNMLQIIQGYAQLAKGSSWENDQGDIGRSLDRILQASKSAAQLTGQLLAFSRKEVLTLAEVDLNELIENLMKMCSRLIGEKIEARFLPSEKTIYMQGDRGALEQVLMNLCINARDAMPDGGRLVLETKAIGADEAFRRIHKWAGPGEYVAISISDTGTGISPENAEHIFGPFFTTKEAGKGTGLGLSVAYGIVERHQGRISVHSEPGLGTTFTIFLPASEDSGLISRETEEQPAVGGVETILVAEDDQEVMELMLGILESQGYTVLAAKDGEEACSVFDARSDSINLVVLDMMMPKKGGKAVYEQIHEAKPSLPVLFSTGYMG